MNDQFKAKVKEVRALIAQGDAKAAAACLNQAWDIAGKVKAQRNDCHSLGNEIQGLIFDQYLKGVNQ